MEGECSGSWELSRDNCVRTETGLVKDDEPNSNTKRNEKKKIKELRRKTAKIVDEDKISAGSEYLNRKLNKTKGKKNGKKSIKDGIFVPINLGADDTASVGSQVPSSSGDGLSPDNSNDIKSQSCGEQSPGENCSKKEKKRKRNKNGGKSSKLSTKKNN